MRRPDQHQHPWSCPRTACSCGTQDRAFRVTGGAQSAHYPPPVGTGRYHGSGRPRPGVV